MSRSFSGTDRVVGAISAVDTGGWTQGAWIYPTALTGLARIVNVNNGSAATPAQMIYLGAASDGKITVQQTFASGEAERSSVASVTANQWNCVIGTTDGTLTFTNAHLYLGNLSTPMAQSDGSSANGVGARSTGMTSAQIGNRAPDWARPFPGRIAQAFMVPWVMTLAECEQFRQGDWTVLYKYGTPRFFQPFEGSSLTDPIAQSTWTATGTTVTADPGVGNWRLDATAVASASPNTFDPLSITTGSFTPVNGSLLVAIVGATLQGGAGSFDVSGGFAVSDTAGLTWTPRSNIGRVVTEGGQIRIFTAPVVTGVSMTVTFTPNSTPALNRTMISVIQVIGHAAASPIGVVGTSNTLAADGADSVTLSGAPAAKSLIIGGRVASCPSTGTVLAEPGTGHTELHDLSILDNAGLQTQQRDIGSTSTAFSWADVTNGTGPIFNGVAAAIEIKAFNNPLDITGCKLWLDANDAGTITLSGAQITQWNDKSGNGWNFIPVAGGVGPDLTSATLNGRPVALFDGSNDGLRNLSLIMAQPFTTFFVLKQVDPTASGAVLRGPTSDSVLGYHPVNGGSMFVGDGTSYPSNTFVFPPNTPSYMSVVHNGASTLARLNGVAKFTGVNCSTGGLPNGTHLGRSAAYADSLGNSPGSYIADVVIYDRVLVSSDILNVEEYLYNKWFVAPAGTDITGTPATVTVTAGSATIIVNPTNIAGCKVWLDGNDVAEFSYSSGVNVSVWGNKGSGTDFTPQGAGSGGPSRDGTLNGKTTVRWANPDQNLISTVTQGQPLTLFVVGKLALVNDYGLIYNSGDSAISLYRPTAASTNIDFFSGSGNTETMDGTNYHLIGWVANGASSKQRIDKIEVGTANTGSSGFSAGVALGDHYSQGVNSFEIAEVIVYDSALSADNIVAIENYLYNKWFVSAGTAITGTPATVAITAGSGQIQLPAAITGTPATVTATAGSGQIQLPAAITGTSATVTVTAGSATVTGHAAIIGTSATVTVTAGSAAITATTAITGTSATVTVTAATGEVGINAPDPVKIADRGVRTSTATGNGTITITNPTLITVGNYLVARVAVDNSGASGARPGLVFSDTRNGTWAHGAGGLQDPGAVSAGVAVYLCYVKVAVAYQAGDVFSFAWTTGTPISSIVVEEWANIDEITPIAVAEVSANNLSSTAQPSIARTPLQVGQLVYVAAALEGFSSYWGVQDTDTTGGSWSDVTKAEANTGSAVTSVSVYGGYKIVTSTAAQTWNNTIGTASDWAAVAVVFAKEIPPTNVTGTPGWVTVIADSAVVAGNAAIIGTSATVSVQAGSGVLTAGTNVTGASATVSVQAGSGVIQFPAANITGTSAVVVVTAGTATITGQTNITGTSAVVIVTASTATITGQTNITGTSATIAVIAGTGNIASQINITGTSATVAVTAGTGIVGTILTIVGTSATVVVTAGSGVITGQTNIIGTSAIVSVQAGSAVLIGSVIGTSATVTIIAGSGVITAHTAITGTPATVAITAGTAPILTGANILGTSTIVSVIAGIGIITGRADIIGLSAIISVIVGSGNITGQANTIGTSAIIAVNAGTGQIIAAGSYVLPAKQGAILVV